MYAASPRAFDYRLSEAARSRSEWLFHIGGPKVENGQWHVNVDYRGSRVFLKPTNWSGCGRYPEITNYCRTIPQA